MPRAGLTPSIVVAEAARVADRVGLDRLTLASVAQQLGVALPSLYKHVRGIDALHTQIAVRALDELAVALSAATIGRSGRDALQAAATAYRDYARRHPGGYAATQRAPNAGDPAHSAAAERTVQVMFAVLSGYGLAGDQLVDATRILRSALHGFVSLEAVGGFAMPRDVDRTFDRLVDAFDGALRAWPSEDADPPVGRTAMRP